MRICVIIPAFNEAEQIRDVVKSVKARGFDVVVIDDGSEDNTGSLAAACGAFIIHNSHNAGKGHSLTRGFEYACDKGYDAVITMDADGQHIAEEIDIFVRHAHSCAGERFIVVGNRMNSWGKMPFTRVITNKFMSWLISRISRQNIPDSQCGFRLIPRKALKEFKLSTQKYEIDSEILLEAARLQYEIQSVNISSIYKQERSRIHPVRDTIRFIKFITSQRWT